MPDTTALLEKLDKPDAWDCVAPDTSRYIIHAQGDRTPEGWVSYQPLFALTPSDIEAIKAVLIEREELREAAERARATRASVSEAAIEPNAMRFFSENVDSWGAAEWFDRLAKAIREQDNAVVAKDDIGFEIYRMIAASSAMTLVRDHECTVRAALSAALASTAETVEPVAWREILAERIRQVEAEGWTPEHDDQHTDNELPRAAACYCIGNIGYWPWDLDWWKPTDRRRNLIKAAALILAEIERIDRSAKGGSHESI